MPSIDDLMRELEQLRTENDIPCSVEISRSGNGAHLWIFFSEPIEAAKARTLGSVILTLAMKQHARLSFHSYDRMFPNQDSMPKSGFGNLIALPLQIAAAKNGGSLFVNEQMQPYADQWVYLSSIKRLDKEQVNSLLSKLHTSPLGTLRPEDEGQNSKPWQHQQAEIKPEDVPYCTEIILADRVYIPVQHFSNRAQNQLKRIAAFRNPQYYRNQAMRMPVWNIPRFICCTEYQGDYLAFPRGCADDVMEWMQANQIITQIIDERCPGRNINVSFNGKLREAQQIAFKALSAHDTGIKNGRNCLLLSERTRHVQILADLLRVQNIPVHVLLGGQTNTQMKSQMAALKDAPSNAPLVICATGKFIGEGFDDSRLDTLFLTMPISWQGTLAQYVGRLHRLHDDKREVRVYDYIDNHAAMLEKMYRKRLKGYASIGYSVAADQQDAVLSSDIIYDQITFQDHFRQDIVQARESVVIVSPYVTVKRVRWIEAALQQCNQRNVKTTVITRTPDLLPAPSRKTADMAISMLRELQVEIVCREGIHQKYAIMDGYTVWYGSINLLSFGTSKESIMRLHSSSIARALMNTEEGENYEDK